MRVFLVKPKYYSPFPPIGLLKFATYYKNRGDDVSFHPHGLETHRERDRPAPDKILITSLWTWGSGAVHREVRLAKSVYPGAEIVLGGIYASMLPEHAKNSGADRVISGLDDRVEDLAPDYSILNGEWNGKKWDRSIVFTSRGCAKNCEFCAVREIEGDIISKTKEQIEVQIYDDHDWIVVMDNNIIMSPGWKTAFDIFDEHNKLMSFNGGIDLREMTSEQASRIANMRTRSSICAGFDNADQCISIGAGISKFEEAGQRARDIMLYELFNFKDTPRDLFWRLKIACTTWKATSYPMRYQPLRGMEALAKDSFIGDHWSFQMLEMVARSRRILGSRGAFPPTRAFSKRCDESHNLLELLKVNTKKGIPRPDGSQTKILDFF